MCHRCRDLELVAEPSVFEHMNIVVHELQGFEALVAFEVLGVVRRYWGVRAFGEESFLSCERPRVEIGLQCRR